MPVEKAPVRGDWKRWRVCLTETDEEAVTFLKVVYGVRYNFEAVQRAVTRQAGRDAGAAPPLAYATALEVAGTVGEWSKGKGLRNREGAVAPVLKRCCFWMGPEHAASVERIRNAWGLCAAAEAVRLAVRVEAELTGFRPPPDGW